MSKVILHAIPVKRKVLGDNASNEDIIALENFDYVHETALTVLSEYLSQGDTIIDSFDSEGLVCYTRVYVLQKSEKSPAISGDISVEVLSACEVKSGFSKSKNENFDYLRCYFGHDAFVNIFDHPEKARNTWDICERRGWTWQSIQDAMMNNYPVPVTLAHDGQRFSLVDIISATEYEFFVKNCKLIAVENEDNNETE